MTTTNDQEAFELESRVLIVDGRLASDALVFSFGRDKTHYFLMTPHLYQEVKLTPFGLGSTSITPFAGGNRYSDGGMDKFVREAIADSKCGGLVPLGVEVTRILEEEHGLGVIARGVVVEPENMQFSVYGSNFS
ncbi:MAG: hypothetical protein AABX11_06115 [Nanoarchaeota archaeon]